MERTYIVLCFSPHFPHIHSYTNRELLPCKVLLAPLGATLRLVFSKDVLNMWKFRTANPSIINSQPILPSEPQLPSTDTPAPCVCARGCRCIGHGQNLLKCLVMLSVSDCSWFFSPAFVLGLWYCPKQSLFLLPIVPHESVASLHSWFWHML